MTSYGDEYSRGSPSRGYENSPSAYYRESNSSNSRSRSISHHQSARSTTQQSSRPRNDDYQTQRPNLRTEKSMPNFKENRGYQSEGRVARPSKVESNYETQLKSFNSQQSLESTESNVSSAVMERMQKGGWLGTSKDSNSGSSSSLSEIDSGYGGSSDGGSYLGSWKGITKAIWGEADENAVVVDTSESESRPSATASQGGQLWDRLMASTSVLSNSISDGIAKARGDEDDDRVDDDGNTKLIRVMKEYHISLATSSSDLPRWLFGDSERKSNTSTAPSPLRTNSDSISRPNYSQTARYQSEPRFDRFEKASDSIGSAEDRRGTPKRHQTMREPERKEFVSSGSRATDRLRVMKEEKRAMLERSISMHQPGRN